ncbi:g8097 [Coccomyxa viridis]|uniref:Phosphotransferase n=1 Tax=Coccomyxa viridis TaxID=1274662 RepID=A0ABP1G4D3_9CHLO
MAQYYTDLALSHSQLLEIRDEFIKEARKGLRGEKSTCLMAPTMVDILPDGDEIGEYYAIDIGGTNFRSIHATLSDKKGEVVNVEMEDNAIPEEYFSCHADQLFDLLASSLLDFAKRHGRHSEDRQLPIGFCFSFPCTHTAIGEAIMVKLTKKFENDGLVGQDPAKGLQRALDRQKANFRVAALINDSVGTLAGGCYVDADTKIGVILGTGTNACYVEEARNISSLAGKNGQGQQRPLMAINTEWGNFDASSLPSTDIDRELDADTPNAGNHHFEKMVSGMYLGEVARRAILKLAEEAELFGLEVPPQLREPWALTTPALAKIDEDASWLLSSTAQVLSETLGLPASLCTHTACLRVKQVCNLVARRSAALVAACLAGLLKQIGRDGSSTRMQPTTIAVDGGLFEHYQAYRGYLRTNLDQLLGRQVSAMVKIVQIRDASSMGAAYLAAAIDEDTQ